MNDFQPLQPVISSSANIHLKLMRSLSRRKHRRAERAFLIEGYRLLEDALDAGVAIRSLLVRDDVDAVKVRTLSQRCTNVHVVAASAFNQSSDVAHSQGVAAICAIPALATPEQLGSGDVLILDQLRDPGNLGTAMRSAAASGVSTVLVTPSSVDPFAPKVVRAAMGAHFRLMVGEFDARWNAALQTSGAAKVYADSQGGLDYDDFDWTYPFVLILGGETEALSPELAGLCENSVRIPMAQRLESLNTAVAGSVVMFEAARQRRTGALLG